LIVLSFKDFDRSQGQSFEDWEQYELLAFAINKLREVCQLTVGQATAQQIIKPNTKVGLPPESSFIHPKHVFPYVIWCTMHIQGKECVIG
jgi:Na+-transporting NADH:ubiquinone oxidoreductase subunit NqrF